jgi:hypothetical protein
MHFDFAPPTVGAEARQAAESMIEEKRRTVEELKRELPSHYEYLRERVYGAPRG